MLFNLYNNDDQSEDWIDLNVQQNFHGRNQIWSKPKNSNYGHESNQSWKKFTDKHERLFLVFYRGLFFNFNNNFSNFQFFYFWKTSHYFKINLLSQAHML